MEYLLGIDAGSTMIKAGIFDIYGAEVSVCAVRCENFSVKPGYYERDVEYIWACTKQAITGVLKSANVHSIEGISLTGHGNGAHLIDHDGNAVCPSIEGADMRASAYISRWMQDGTFDAIHPRNMQALWPALSLCVMAWLRDNAPDIMERTAWFLSVKDYIRYRLTGEVFLDYSDATGSGLINTRERRVDRDMLEIAGLGSVADKLPPLRHATQSGGSVSAQAAAETGLVQGTPVAMGCYDIDSAGLAVGMVDESVLNVIVGSWANNQVLSKKPVVNKEFFSTTVYGVEGYYLMLEGSPTSASNMEWFVERFLQLECEQAKQSGRSVYEICNDAVRCTLPEESRVLFLPFLYGCNYHTRGKATLIGMEGWHKREHVIRAIFEGICFSHKWHIQKMRQQLKLPQIVRMAGGASKSAEWKQMFADVLNMTIETTGATEIGALGAAMCAAVCVGIYDNLATAAQHMVKVEAAIQPNAAAVAVYEEKYQQYLKALSILEPLWS